MKIKALYIIPIAIVCCKITTAQAKNDSLLIHVDTLRNKNFLYEIQLKQGKENTRELYIIKKRDTLIKKINYSPSDSEFLDANNDGFLDILFRFPGNVPGMSDLFLFDAGYNTFKEVAGFRNYPDPKRILNTKFLYSYRRSGCADMNWDSDLFFIDKNFKPVKVANIHAIECNTDRARGIFVYKIAKNKRRKVELIENPIEGDKWDFIDKYWKKNYKKLL